jgi:hypothetical protein
MAMREGAGRAVVESEKEEASCGPLDLPNLQQAAGSAQYAVQDDTQPGAETQAVRVELSEVFWALGVGCLENVNPAGKGAGRSCLRRSRSSVAHLQVASDTGGDDGNSDRCLSG